MNKYLLFIVIFCLSVNVTAQKKAQNTNDDIDIDELIENMVNDSEDADINFDTHAEILRDYLERPLNLNKATYSDFAALGLLSDIQINAILNHREKFGNFITVYELQTIPELSLKTLRYISPFIKAQGIDAPIPFGQLLGLGQHQVYMRYQRVLEAQSGYQADTLADSTLVKPYKGSPDKLYLRYRYNYGTNISYGITAEKDPGEQIFGSTQPYGFDFYSAHLFLRNRGRIKALAIGDYELRLGQGLVAWTGLGFGKGTYVMNIARNAQPLKQYSSVNESVFFRGAAATLDLGNNFELTAFASYKPLDANVTVADTLNLDELASANDPENEESVGLDPEIKATAVSSIQTSGYHRTESEIADKNAIDVFMTGGSLGYRSRRFSLGLNAAYATTSADLNFTERGAYTIGGFEGKQFLNASIDYRYLYRNLHFFGEAAVNETGALATLHGLLLGLDPKVAMSVLYRNYSHLYHAPYPSAFGEGTAPNNEKGLFMGTIITPVKHWSINAYFDVYQHPWLRFRIDAPSYGSDYLVQLMYKPSRKMMTYVRYRSETKKRNATANTTPTDFLVDHTKSSLRYHFEYSITKSLKLKTRVEGSWYKEDFPDNPTGNRLEKGYMLMQDFVYKPLSSPFSFSTRYALFDTEGYDTRIYSYESDLLYVYSVPPYYNKGSRFYFSVRYKAMRNIDLWLRYSQTYWQDQDVVGSGYEQINSNTKSEIKAMMRIKF